MWKRVERMSELQAAPAGIRVIGREQRHGRLIVDGGAGLGRRTIVDGDLSGENQRTRPLARRRQPTFNDELIETDAGHRDTTVGSDTGYGLRATSVLRLLQFDRLTIHLPIARSRSSSIAASRSAASARSRHSAAMRRDVSRP